MTTTPTEPTPPPDLTSLAYGAILQAICGPNVTLHDVELTGNLIHAEVDFTENLDFGNGLTCQLAGINRETGRLAFWLTVRQLTRQWDKHRGFDSIMRALREEGELETNPLP